jgi:cytidylate kinase
MNIAIDGPAGAGKSTIAKKAAGELGFIYVDTGAMYRAVAVYLTESDISASDEDLVEKSIADISVEIKYEDGAQQVYLNGENVTGKLRTAGNMASKASALPCVREKLLSLQRDLAASNDVVMDGRDIGTNILPSAELKVYLTASSAVRAKRRYDELVAKGVENIDIEKIEQDIIQRDKQDMERKTAPLKRADDAVLIDSSDMTIEQVTDTIVGLARERM